MVFFSAQCLPVRTFSICDDATGRACIAALGLGPSAGRCAVPQCVHGCMCRSDFDHRAAHVGLHTRWVCRADPTAPRVLIGPDRAGRNGDQDRHTVRYNCLLPIRSKNSKTANGAREGGHVAFGPQCGPVEFSQQGVSGNAARNLRAARDGELNFTRHIGRGVRQ